MLYAIGRFPASFATRFPGAFANIDFEMIANAPLVRKITMCLLRVLRVGRWPLVLR